MLSNSENSKKITVFVYTNFKYKKKIILRMKYTIFESMHVFNMHAIYFRVYVQRLGGNITILWEKPIFALLSISYISIARKKNYTKYVHK